MTLKPATYRRGALSVAVSLIAIGSAEYCLAQTSSLYARDKNNLIPLSTSSLTYREVLPPREIKLNDLVTVVVIESSQLISEGEFDGRKNASFDAQLKSWIELNGLDLKPAPQRDGDPRQRHPQFDLPRRR